MIALLATVTLWWLQRDSSAAARPPVYAALGASDTVGVGADDPTREGWAPRVHAALPRGTQFLNLGISGATLQDVLVQQLPPAVDAQPRLVTIWGGVNDLRAGVDVQTFQRQLDEVLTQLDQSSAADVNSPTVAVLNIPDLRSLPVFARVDQAALNAEVLVWNAAIADSAAQHGAVLVDLYARWPELALHPEYISGDGFHPSSAGYERIAALVLDAIQPYVSSLEQ
jgi:lysophospholipase L1-like esterase